MSPLVLEGLTKHFGGVTAVNDVHLEVRPGERRIIVGPNGAGKTTLFNLITGTVHASSGQITLLGHHITDAPIHQRSRLGLGRTFQITSLFQGLDTMENAILAVQAFEKDRWIPYRSRSHYRPWFERADKLLNEWHLAEWAATPVKHLSHGAQRQLEIVLAMASSPRVLLLDEPTQGLSAAETTAVCTTIEKIGRDVTILMIEHDLEVAFSFADVVTVMHQGKVLMEGTAEEVRTNPLLDEVYFGIRDSAAINNVETM